MKKRDKLILVADIVIGIVLLVIGVVIQVDYYSTLIFALGFSLAFSSSLQLWRFYRNTRPENIEAYQEKIRQRDIELKDERKVQLRNRAGYLTWAITMIASLTASFVAALLRVNPAVIASLFLLAILELIVATVIYNYLSIRL